ncbi:MAG TPA: polysaccharide pyruvyl transferase family protein, partial [Azospirillaceae bacterium]|nr:polysaccharide pyruvyl transferase family protein [Azospirillaceae bacterium]
MRRVFLTGHRSFANHGCEALVRSAVALFGEALGEVEFLVPSADPEEDAGFWPQAAERGVRFVAPVDAPRLYVWWARACRRLSAWRRLPWPPFPIGADLCRHLEATDLLIATGGDNYTLDYGLDSLSGMIGIDGRAMDLGIPAVLWGASVGPFDAVPEVVPRVRRHLARFGLIVARETVTRDYLATMGLAERMRLSADPAFVMAPEPFDLQGIMPAVG